jgi:hypothetical protein
MDHAPFTFPDDMTLEGYEFYRPARPLPQYMPPGEAAVENLNLSEPTEEHSQNASV